MAAFDEPLEVGGIGDEDLTTTPSDDDDFPGGDDDVPLPMVVAWEGLDASSYDGQLRELDRWVRWLCETYVVDAAALPNCWFLHTDLREELGHLRTGWSMTRHPQAGVGAIGLDWDRHRDATLVRCKSMTSAAGCSPSVGHRDRKPRQWPAEQVELLADHVRQQRETRDSAGISAAAERAVLAVLASAELRDVASAEALADSAADPARPTPAERVRAIELVTRSANAAVEDAEEQAKKALRARRDLLAASTDEDVLDAARDGLADAIAALVVAAGRAEDARTVVADPALVHLWVEQLEQVSSASAAVDAAVGRSSAADGGSAAAVLARHQDATRLLNNPPPE
ncbi:hypothetical protein [Nakamurella lactea]|uniref:hypothetical protein n=1 Tax=Nakamurella lactea TaxID=459515 RepID=UPI00048F2A4F|nr:hypothetical protein [Nakamurella lactea]